MNVRKICPVCHNELRVTQIESKRVLIVHLYCDCGFNKRVKFPKVKSLRRLMYASR